MFLRNNKWNTTPYNRFGGGCGGSSMYTYTIQKLLID